MNTMTQDSSTGLWNNKNRKIFFWSILALAVILRCIRFATVPDGINQDEAMGAVDAWALSKYGTDRYGTFLPVHFTAWRYSQMSVLLAYCMVPFKTVRIQHGNGASADGTDLLRRGGIGISCGQEIIL